MSFICLQCGQPASEAESYQNQVISICQEGHLTGFIAGLSEQEKQAVIAEIFTAGVKDQAI